MSANITKTGTPVIIGSPQPLNYSNAPMMAISELASKVMSKLGYQDCSDIKGILESGGCGVVPLIALSDDVNEFRKKLGKDFSLPNAMALSCIGSEIAFDLYEFGSSIAQYNKLDSLQNACDLVSSEVMGAKVLGSIPLAILSIDEAYAQIFEKPGFLGSKPNLNSAHRNTGEVILSESFIGQMLESNSTIVPNLPNNVDFKIKLGAVLRASEVGFAAISNIALFYEGRGGPIYATTSVLSNVFKFCRIAYNQSV